MSARNRRAVCALAALINGRVRMRGQGRRAHPGLDSDSLSWFTTQIQHILPSFPSNYRNSHDGAPHFPRAPKGTLMLNVIMLGSVSSVFSSLTANYGHSRVKTHVHDAISCSIKLLFPHSWKVRFDGIILPRFVPHVATLIPSAAFTTRIVFL